MALARYLPEALERDLWRAVEALEKEGLMPYVTSYERMYEERFTAIGETRGETRGKAIGEEIGKAIGEEVGKVEGRRELLRGMIERRFGAVPETLERRIETADQAALDGLADRLLAATMVEDLLAEE